MAATTIVTRTGARLGLTAFGDPAADRVVVLCHPTPGAAIDPEPVVTDRWGVHLVVLDRPGYGASDPVQDGRRWTVLDHAGDVGAWVRRAEQQAAEVSSAQLDRYGVIGWGTGGFVAAAIAATDPKVDRLALVDVPRPAKTERILDRAAKAPRGLAALGVAEDDPDLDRHVGLLGRLERSLGQAFVQGRAGVEEDRRLFADDGWIDRLGDIRADTHLWFGDRDPDVAALDARWWADRIRGAQASRVRDSGPLVLAAAWSRILGHVAPNHGSIAEELRDGGDVRVAAVDHVHPEHG